MINISISTNLLIVISCLVLLVIIGIIVYIIYKDKKIDQEEINDLIDDISKAKPRDDEIKVTKINAAPKQEPVDLEKVLKVMEQNLDQERQTIDSYEKDQEENAIISYKELIKQNQNIDSEPIPHKEEVSSVSNLEAKEDLMMSSVKKAISKIESPREEKDKKFKNTDFISPIFGKMDNKIEYPKVKAFDENADLTINEYFGEDIKSKYNDSMNSVLNIDKYDSEEKRNAEFLRALKEFRNNL